VPAACSGIYSNWRLEKSPVNKRKPNISRKWQDW